MKKVLAVLATLMLTLTMALPASAATSAFSDVPYTNWAYPYVQRAAGEDWVNGVGGGRYAPNDNVTGAEFVTMITRAFYLPECQAAAPGQPWYQGYVNTANTHGLLTHGINSSTALNTSLNRYNMAVVLYNLADEENLLRETENGFLSQDGAKEWTYRSAQNSIADWNSVPSRYREPVLACYSLGILSGTDSKGTFDGNSPMTRAQAAVVLCKTDDDANSTGNVTGITKEQAQQIALQDAGVAQSGASFVRAYEDWDDGRSVYEVEFYANGTEYDYEIEKSTGKILSRDWDIENWAPSNPGTGSTGSAVTLNQAKQMVLDRVPGMSASSVRIQRDWDDGRQVYEGEAYYGDMEYEFEIDASTGRFLDWSVDYRWD